ncbi:MAG: hypothetical protein ABSG19_10995 [Candidatus Aminicenantales bacterium]
MLPKPPAGLAAMITPFMVLALTAGLQETPAPPTGLIRTFFTAHSAKADDSLSEEARKEFEDDNGRPLRSVAIDLNGDGKDEKFFLSSVASKSGGSQWLICDPATNAVRGVIIGSIIFVERDADGGFARLETYWKQGGDMSVVFNYTFSRSRYVRVNSRSLTVPEIDEYFRTKPPIDLDKELVEIKAQNDISQQHTR